jgi:hypothetical protein
MKDNVIMRCGTNFVTLVMFNDSGVFTDAISYPIHHDGSGDEAWLTALSHTIDGIPSDFRFNTLLVIPPNNNIFVKCVELPEVSSDNCNQALKFEFKRNFPGNEEDWIWDTCNHEIGGNWAFIVAMQRIFAERLLDVLLRRKVNFSYLCPEVVLNAIAMQEQAKNFENTMLLHIGSNSSLIAINGKDSRQHIRIIPLAFDWVDEQISASQKIPQKDARKIKLDYAQNLSQSASGLTFVTYYIKQFANKIQQELKRSELFFCKTFKQAAVRKIVMSGKGVDIVTFLEIMSEFNSNATIEIAGKSVSGSYQAAMGEDKQRILSNNVFAYVGAVSCILTNTTKLINLFSENFKNQISFQRRHPSYMAAMVTVIFASILGLKLLLQQVSLLESKKFALEAKLRESTIDSQKYHEAITSERKIRDSIVKIKGALYSQDAWINLFNDLHQSIKILKTSWIDSVTWHDSADGSNRDTVHVVAKIFSADGKKLDEMATGIEQFLATLKQSSNIAATANTVISPIEGNVLTFSFDIKLNSNSKIIAQ